MSIPLINDVNKNDINTSIIAIKKDLERINTLLGLNNTEEIDTSVFATKEELEQAETDLAPIDEVTSGNMQSVTSNAVANELIKYMKPLIGAGWVSTLAELENMIVQGQTATACFGSQQITDGPNGNTWYNFIYIPHRTGVGQDNYQYGSLLLFNMTSNTNNMWICHLIGTHWYSPQKISA